MKTEFFKKSLSALLSAAMLLTAMPAVLAGAAEGKADNVLQLTWPEAGTTRWGKEGTVPQWAQNATPEEQQATIDAINKEYLDQKEAGYDLGKIEHPEFEGGGFSSWGDMVNVQFVGGDNQGNPWEQPDRNWACIVAPFAGMAFSIRKDIVPVYTSGIPISNSFQWTDPRNGNTLTWQMFTGNELFTGANNGGRGYAPGSTLTGPVVDAMVEAYARNAFYDITPGMTEQNGRIDASGIVYQEFWGPESTGKTQQTSRQDTAYGSYGITYLVAKDLEATEAYVVTGDILTAWATTWGNPESDNPDRFSASGVPVEDRQIAQDGTVTQRFEKMLITVKDGEATIQSTDNSMTDFAIPGGTVYLDGSNLDVVMPTGTDVKSLTPTFTIHEKAAAQPASGTAQDFSEPVTYTVTSESGEKQTYTVTVYVAPETPAPADKAAAEEVDTAIAALPGTDALYLNHREAVEAARAAYEALEPLQKILVENLDKLTAAEDAIKALEENPIRVTFVGDSITEGVGASNASKNYVNQAGKLLGDEFTVFNAGVGGKTLLDTNDAYTDTSRYTEGKNFAPDVVTIMLGTNDSKTRYWGSGSAAYGADAFAEQLADLINEYKSLPSNPVVFVATSPTVYGTAVDSINDPAVTEIVEVQKEVAAAEGCPVIDINAFTKNHSDWFGDGVHPNDNGYAQMATAFAEAIANVNTASLSSLRIGDTEIPLEEGQYTYTGYLAAGDEMPQVSAENNYGADVTVDQPGDDSVATITVTTKKAHYQQVYTVNLIEDISSYLKGDVSSTVYADRITGTAAIGPHEDKNLLFDHKPETKFMTQTAPGTDAPVTISFEIFYPEAIANYAIVSAGDEPGRDPKSWILYGRNASTEEWTVIDSRTDETFDRRGQRKVYQVENPAAYSQYKLDITANNGAAGTQLADLQIATGEDVNLHLTWPEGAWNEGTPQEWVLNATEEEKAATLEAFDIAYNRLLDAGYNIGRERFGGGPNSLGAWNNYANLQCEGTYNDNVGDPWNMGRKWGMLAAARPGVVFAVKGNLSANCAPSLIAYGNDLVWTDPATGESCLYQVFSGDTTVKMNPDGSGEESDWPGYGIGTGASDAVKAAMEEAYIQSGWDNESFGRPYNLGFPAGEVRHENGVTFQEYFGNDSTGASPEAGREGDYGISYLVAADENPEEAYIITDKIFTAWTSTWSAWQNGGSVTLDRFSSTGLPTGNQYIDDEGNIVQEFEKATITIDGQTGDSQVVLEEGRFLTFQLPESVQVISSLQEGRDFAFIVDDSTDLGSIAPVYTLYAGMTCDIASGEAVDFSSPVTYTVTSHTGAKTAYTVTIRKAGNIPAEDAEAAGKVTTAISELPNPVYLNHQDLVQAAAEAYNTLTSLQKLLVEGLDKLAAAQTRLVELDGPIRVTCVGDSITQGIGAGAGESYPDQMQEILGDGYLVCNAGISGSNILKSSSTTFPYWTSSEYTKGKEFQPDIVLMMLGTNDATNRNWVESSIPNIREQFKEDYRDLIEEYKALDSDPYIFLVLPMTCYGSGNQDRMTNLTNDIIPALKELAEEENVGLIDMHTFTAGHNDWFPDDLHPNAEAYGIIAEEFASYVTDYAEKAAINTLSGIQLDGEALEGFSADTTSYTVELEAGAELPVITADGAFEGADVSVAEDEEAGTASITVTSADGRYQQTYTLAFQWKPAFQKGDLNKDNAINIQDVMSLCRVLARRASGDPPTDDEWELGDINEDEAIDIQDVMSLCRILARQK